MTSAESGSKQDNLGTFIIIDLVLLVTDSVLDEIGCKFNRSKKLINISFVLGFEEKNNPEQ